MPPRNASDRGAPCGGGKTPTSGDSRGGAGRGSRPGPAPATAFLSLEAKSDIVAVHLRRPGFGKVGRQITVTVNSFAAKIPQATIVHYDVSGNSRLVFYFIAGVNPISEFPVVEPDRLPARFNLQLFTSLQDSEPNIFTPKIVYDGRKNSYAPRELALGGNSRKFTIGDPSAPATMSGRPPKVYHITLTKVATINNELLHRFVAGKQEYDENISTAIMAHNVAIRMEPNLKHPFDKRSFYISDDRQNIGRGLELWRGIFQSVRPAIGRIIINVDLKAGVFFKAGSLLALCMDFMDFNGSPTTVLSADRLTRQRRNELRKFLTGIRVQVPTTGNKLRTIRGISDANANTLSFPLSTGAQTTVSQYFASLSMPLQHTGIICVLVGASAMIPLEVCHVPEGQFARKQLSEDQLRELQTFSTIKPMERLAKIKAGLAKLQHGQSDYVRQFGMEIDADPLTNVPARILDPPEITYKLKGKNEKLTPRAGTWHLQDKQFYQPAKIFQWAILIYESKKFVPAPALTQLIKAFLATCQAVGINVVKQEPIYKYENPLGDIDAHIKGIGKESLTQLGDFPSLIVVILPRIGTDIRNAVKYIGNTQIGVATQCLQGSKCLRATSSYWTNVMQKYVVNTRLGGINSIATSQTFREFLLDKANPTIVMGADVIHPSPGVKDRPSFAAVVGAVDSNAAYYTDRMSVQIGRKETILDMKKMCKSILSDCMEYRKKMEKNPTPLKRLLFYRDGVSEGQFTDTLDTELKWIREACQELSLNPKITLVIVGKRHHNQIFSPKKDFIDKSGNLVAGTVIDTVIVHPTDFDFILQSHGGQLGTSRPGHYSVLCNEIGFGPDAMQTITNDLCYTYARCTRSVSIPSPVYYADMVCSTAKLRYDPTGRLNFSDTGSQASGSDNVYLEAFQSDFKDLHGNQKRRMYFVVSSEH
ncbi:argonaute-like protein [Crepidotus variabilis]|uniref:Argonaute-like protein n=1 Tax=Crepidotus variabilis TaxID=179855 RepID=A0A9P6EEY1_9AGAR|nr:argonaute-like protein [Crepidotus variabilis]